MVAVFFNVEMAYDMMWKAGLLIKLNIMGVGGRAYKGLHFWAIITSEGGKLYVRKL